MRIIQRGGTSATSSKQRGYDAESTKETKVSQVEKVCRVSFLVPEELLKRSQAITWGGRSPALRVLFEKLIDSVEKHGTKMIGAIIDGEFEIVPKERKR